MAIKPPDILNRLPSVSELLDKPPIRALADRWNRSVVASGVRSFLDELTTDLRRRAADVQLPSIRELAESAARYVVSRQHQQLGTAINATGRVWGTPWMNRPLPDAALERAVAIAREFVADPSNVPSQNAAIEAALCQLAGSRAALAVHSYPGALWLALATLAVDRDVLVARAEVGDIGPAEPLPDLVASAQARLREVGATNRALTADYEAAVSASTAVLLTIRPDEYRVIGQTAAAEIKELADSCRRLGFTLIAALGASPLVGFPESLEWPQSSASAALADGADLVAIRGDGLLGGPPCGILLGRRDLVTRISQHPLMAAWRLDAFRSAALAATLECHQAPARSAENLPIWQLLTTPVENLRNRAERIAPQLAQAKDVASATAVETRSPISAALSPEAGLVSYGVAVTGRAPSITDLDNRLRALPFPVLARIEHDRLILDLRTVLPRQDRVLVEAIVGTSVADHAAESEDKSG